MIKKQPNINFGAAILFLIFGLLFFVLLYRIVSIQVTGEAAGQPLAVKAKQKYQQEQLIEAKRGTIYDRNGEVIAEDTASFTLLAILDKKMKPDYVSDPEKTARELSKVIDMKESEIYRLLSKKDLFQVEFGKAGSDITFEKKKEIEKLELPGITFLPDTKRFYPNGVFASHLVGFVEKKDGVTKGQLGIEKSLDDTLSGTNGKIEYESDLWGYLLPDGKEKIKPAKNGNDIYLTIDKKIQTFLEQSLNKVTKKYNPKKVVVVVADPKTGDILAMGQRPTFHPSTREGLEKSWYNEAVENSFEPGSTMKIFTLAAAVQENVFNPTDKYRSGSYKATANSRAINDHNYGLGWGSISYLEGVQRSSNVAFAKIAKEKLGFKRYREYLTKFGLDHATGIDLPNETEGKIVYQYPVDKITTAFGQGSAITPIQQIQASTAVGNNGNMMKPHVVKKVVDSDTNEIIKENKPEVVGTPISKQSAKEVRDILETVVSSEKGTGYKRFNIPGYKVAGKTGTAQIPGPSGYLTGHKNFIFSFLGMAPKDDPKLIVYVAVQQPDIDESTNGAEPVAEIFKSVMKNSLQYLNIKPVKQKTIATNKVPNVEGLPVSEAEKMLEDLGMDTVVIGKGNKVIAQSSTVSDKVLEGEKIILKTEGKLSVPNLSGWSLRDAMKVARIANLQFNRVGNGYVVKQNIKAGSSLKEGDYLVVELQTPEEQLKKAKSKSKEKAEEKDVGA